MTHAHGSHGHAHGGHDSGPSSAGPLPASRHAEGGSYAFVAVPHSREKAQLEPGAGSGKVLFFDCASGIAGDMTIAALLDLGLPSAVATEAIRAVPGLELDVEVRAGRVGSLGATQFVVQKERRPRHRTYAEIRELLEQSALQEGAKKLAQSIFRSLGEAEAEVHRMALEQVEFHEVGSSDAIADVVGASALISYLGAKVISSPVPLGRGWVQSAHGALPLPAPATLLCLTGVPTYPSGLTVELVTPTGAAILKNVATEFCEWPPIQPELVGLGAGQRTLEDRPNVLRAILGDRTTLIVGRGELARLDANLDDVTPEVLAYVQARLLAEGALDVWLTPIVMKKSRPGMILSVLASLERAEALSERIFAETTTLGVRKWRVSRSELPRRIEQLATRFGPVRYKISGDPPLTVKVEIEDAIRIAEAGREPLRKVLEELNELGRAHFPTARRPESR
jgi:pyridinium-3,5-bisthiocarboxylic acid mononucleotide nickel chelatase